MKSIQPQHDSGREPDHPQRRRLAWAFGLYLLNPGHALRALIAASNITPKSGGTP